MRAISCRIPSVGSGTFRKCTKTNQLLNGANRIRKFFLSLATASPFTRESQLESSQALSSLFGKWPRERNVKVRPRNRSQKKGAVPSGFLIARPVLEIKRKQRRRSARSLESGVRLADSKQRWNCCAICLRERGCRLWWCSILIRVTPADYQSCSAK
jgi:hypothetical protein